MRLRSKGMIIGAAALLGSGIFMAPFCGWMFSCGCSWLWTTAGQLCNIHHSNGPHCPWCSHGLVGKMIPLAGFSLCSFAAGMLVLRSQGKLALALGISLIALFPAGVLMGLITVMTLHYPHFFLFR